MICFICFLAIILTVNGNGYYGRPPRDCDPYRVNYYQGADSWPANPDYYPSYPHPVPWNPYPMPWDPYPMPRDPYPWNNPYTDNPYTDNDDAYFPHPVRDAISGPNTDNYPRDNPYTDSNPYNNNDNAYFPHPVRDALRGPNTETYYPVRCGDESNGLPYEELKEYIRKNRHPGPPTGDEDDIPSHNGGSGGNVCELPKVVGPCKASLRRYYYDCADNACKMFIYGGCRGNDNNFLTLEACERKCLKK